ncbi:heterokaryon incompatibility [Patellaria atrata CBS 101060]|uniref:Heterokaryon incompatibility n=1 Tax=Patellaria atrata CBS 101060 TaxID=1346257 RepID=A0A9P4SH97_9PEZI|nr:heterokaryon incompatibility [Patellaria atrata CBS 101060]
MTRNEGIIDCRLIHVQLESRQCPDYCALSYAWGDHALTQPVRINGRWFKITENLYDALSTLSDLHIYSTTWYWVDAICISHSDDLEKGIQVSQMGTIFGQCERVVAWTGPEGDDSEEALDFIQLLSYGYNSVEDLEEWLRRLVRKEEYRFMWSSLDRLLGRPWWRRAWILQECIIR